MRRGRLSLKRHFGVQPDLDRDTALHRWTESPLLEGADPAGRMFVTGTRRTIRGGVTPGPTRVAMSLAISSFNASLARLNAMSMVAIDSIGAPRRRAGANCQWRTASLALSSRPKPSPRTTRAALT